MKAALLALALLVPAAPAWAQHEGHVMPAPADDPHAGHDMAAPAADDPHAGHDMSGPATDPHAGHTAAAPAAAADPHAGHDMGASASSPIGKEPPPEPPADHAAERFYSPQAMAAARGHLAKEHGGGTYWTVRVDTLEYRAGDDEDGYAWEGEFRRGGDINRFVGKFEGEGSVPDGLHKAEIQALYSRAISPYFDLQAGVRHDLEPQPGRSYAAVGFEGLAPYWFEVEGAVFVSDRGDVSARLEASYDLRLTQKLVLQPRVELNLSAREVADLELGAGFTDAEAGLRLHYAFKPEFAPYIGVNYGTSLGETADYARARGDSRHETAVVLGIRVWR